MVNTMCEKWRLIETAPRDGSYIILGYADSHSEEGRWMGNAGQNHWGEIGWFATDDDVLCNHPGMPTHWMPLPDPPTTQPEIQKGNADLVEGVECQRCHGRNTVWSATMGADITCSRCLGTGRVGA